MDTKDKSKGEAMSLPAIMNPDPNPKFTVTATGIEFFGDLSMVEWDELGRRLAPVGRSIGFLLGDWINYGSKAYGTKYKAVLDATGIPYQRLRNYASVARRVHPTLREPGLGIEHHAAVAGLEAQEQHHWLKLTKAHNLSVPRLRKSIQLGRLVSEEEMEDAGGGNRQINHVALINRLVLWWTSETCKAPVAAWHVVRREAIKRDFEQLLAIYRQL